MTDEKPVPETLETIAEQISALSTSMEKRFGELKAQLGVKIEAVDANVRLVYDVIITQQQHNTANEATHATFTKRIDNHELRIRAIEPRKPRRS